MPGIQLPIGIDMVNPVPADFKYGPYANTAAAIAAIPLALRFDGLTVQITGTGEYHWLAADLSNAGLIPKSSGGGPTIILLTRVALQALITGNTVVPGQWYGVTDAQDSLGGIVHVLGSSINTIDASGFWAFTSQLPAFGTFRLSGGAAGSVNQVTTSATALMTAAVPFSVNLVTTANNVAANINANTGVSGHTARVIAGVNRDRPTIVIQKLAATTGATNAIVVSVTTITVSNLTTVRNGVTASTQVIQSFYDIVNDRIVYAKDLQNNVEVSCTVARIAALTYNPITTYRWGDPRFQAVKMVESGMKDMFFGDTITVKRPNITLISCNFSLAVITTWQNVYCFNSTITNVNTNNFTFATNTDSGVYTLTNIDIASFNISSNTNQGSIIVTSSSFGTSTTAASLFIQNNTVVTGSTIQVTSCNIQSVGGLSDIVYNIFGVGANVLMAGITLLPSDFTIFANFVYNNIQFGGTFANLLIISCRSNYVEGRIVFTTNTFGVGTQINIERNFFYYGDGSGLGLQVSGALFTNGISIYDSRIVTMTLSGGPRTYNTFNILSTTMDGIHSFNNSAIPKVLDLNYTHLGNTNNFTAVTDLVLNYSVIEGTTVSVDNFNASQTTISYSQIIYSPLLGPTSTIVTFDKCTVKDSVLGLCNGESGVDPVAFVDTVINKCTWDIGALIGSGGIVTITRCQFTNVTIESLGIDTGLLSMTDCQMVNGLIYSGLYSYFPTTFNLTYVNIETSVLLVAFSGSIAATNCAFSNVGSLTVPGTTGIIIDNNMVLLNTTVDNYDYTVKVDSVSALTVGVPVALTKLLTNFNKKSITYTSNASLIGGSLKIGYGPTNNQYLPVTTVAAINAVTAQEDTTLDTNYIVAANDTLNIEAVGANLTAGYLIIMIKGTLLQSTA